MKKYIIIGLFASLVFVAAFAQNTSPRPVARIKALVKPLSIDDVAAKADLIFRGRLISKKNKRDSKSNMTVRELKFVVQDYIRPGAKQERVVTLREWAELDTPFVRGLRKNKSYVFFFSAESELGLRTLTGFEQGVVDLEGEKPILHTLLDADSPTAHVVQHKLALRHKKPKRKFDNYQSFKRYCALKEVN